MSVSSQFPNTRKLMKARVRRPSAFIVFKCWNRWNTKHSFLKLLLNRASLTKNNETKKNQKMFLLLISFSFSLNSDNTRMAYLVTGLLYVWGWRYLFFEVWNLFRTFKARFFCFWQTKLYTIRWQIIRAQMNDHIQGFNFDGKAVYLMAYLVAGFTWIYTLLDCFLLMSFWESMFLIKESPMIKTRNPSDGAGISHTSLWSPE